MAFNYVGVIISWLLLILSTSLLLLIHHDLIDIPFQWWLHVAILVIAGLGVLKLRKSYNSKPVSPMVFMKGLPRWMGLIGIILVILVIPPALSIDFQMGHTVTGEPVTQRTWYERDGKYYLSLNREAETEITAVEYKKLDDASKKLFSLAWIFVSYISLAFWTYLRRNVPGGVTATKNEADPIAEAEVYIAYGRKRQAIEVLERALTENPHRADVQEKLDDLINSGIRKS